MFCPKCGKKCKADDEFCSKCGHKFTRDELTDKTHHKQTNPKKTLIICIPIAALLIIGIIIILLGGNQNSIGIFAKPTLALTPFLSLSPTPTPIPSFTPTPIPTSTPTLAPTPSPIQTLQPYTREEQLAAKGILALKKTLKNPDSLQIHEVTHWTDEQIIGEFVDEIDCSAQNGYGGMDRTNYIFTTNKSILSLHSDGWWDDEYGLSIFTVSSAIVGNKLDIDRILEIVKSLE
jgi:hypothetical protein